ncbi:DUF998 domain-containing protein [Xanthomonas maliensis]|uniref:DUF998 domain-containing protein n=2 Tax=Xanthomonas maliensis TaxID=1321368 RepID=UPI003CCDE0D6
MGDSMTTRSGGASGPQGWADAAVAPWSRQAGRSALWVGIGFLLLVLVLQVVRTDLDWVQSQLSAYLHGAYGLLLRTAYCLLALAIAWLASGLQAALAPPVRSATVVGLFWMAGVGLSAVAIGDSWMPQLAPAAAPMVHQLAAQTAFLCVIAAVLLQSCYFHRDPRWRRHARAAICLGVLAFGALLLHATTQALPRGLGQKIAIVLIVAWLTRAGAWLAAAERRAVCATTATQPGPVTADAGADVQSPQADAA